MSAAVDAIERAQAKALLAKVKDGVVLSKAELDLLSKVARKDEQQKALEKDGAETADKPYLFQKGHAKIPGAGRPPGIAPPSIKTLRAKLVEYECDPSEILILIALGDSVRLKCSEEIPIALRQKAASDLCSFIMPKMKALELSGEVTTKQGGVLMIPEVKSMEEWKRLVEAKKAEILATKATSIKDAEFEQTNEGQS